MVVLVPSWGHHQPTEPGLTPGRADQHSVSSPVTCSTDPPPPGLCGEEEEADHLVSWCRSADLPICCTNVKTTNEMVVHTGTPRHPLISEELLGLPGCKPNLTQDLTWSYNPSCLAWSGRPARASRPSESPGPAES